MVHDFLAGREPIVPEAMLPECARLTIRVSSVDLYILRNPQVLRREPTDDVSETSASARAVVGRPRQI